ncbi:MAG: hypothetical protein HONBIEJF_01413 [Fimbriimonadaceae bacterium]|nr:hypothetical protein [Fimbriimonadaceae bacterium]
MARPFLWVVQPNGHVNRKFDVGDNGKTKSGAGAHGISLFTSLGVAIAVQISWTINHSIGWAIWHGILGWIYVIYRWIVGVPGVS